MVEINPRAPTRKSKILAFAALILLMVFSALAPALAQNLTQGYRSEGTMQRGMLVAGSKNDPETIEPLTNSSLDRAKGVVVQQNDSPVTLSSDDSKIFVADNGSFEVLVVDQNGGISEGDYISISGLEGVGMKADVSQPVVVGRAIDDFNGQSNAIGSTTIGDSEELYNIGRIRVNIAITDNPLYIPEGQNNILSFLQGVGNTVADKPVDPIRLYLSTFLFLATVGVVSFMLYGGARNSMIAIGRNPLSKRTILRGLVQIVLVSLIIFVLGLSGIYLLLKL